VLIRTALQAYEAAVRRALHEAGFGDLSLSGSYVITSIPAGGSSLNEIAGELGMSKQAVSHWVDALAEADYLHRRADPADRRRLIVTLAERGAGAAAVVNAATRRLEARLAERVGDELVADARTTLMSLGGLALLSERPGPLLRRLGERMPGQRHCKS
jgi:DNA-binding MarR family transcriptional regulator